ncbi:hypothetical protein FOH10_21125 [Nocardia otitidiscaviarum]|uniref:Uncharacterized protein n=1 Tax=Nocardia otitidiscaviarum TaxID=1823 RepID=A0A516NPM5_9NOCA|nr:hypothetical protein [Nocardia otitidiscaviarum]MCP9623870.1 hypothetical protein [Nocardia otitidiscaviarum]QDP80839.1 hypothetical protein FOH10_21125 [Nocardia otitidiscaviarum]
MTTIWADLLLSALLVGLVGFTVLLMFLPPVQTGKHAPNNIRGRHHLSEGSHSLATLLEQAGRPR